MPICAVCDAKYSSQGWSAPATECDCGVCNSGRDESDDTRHRLLEQRRTWLAHGKAWPTDEADRLDRD